MRALMTTLSSIKSKVQMFRNVFLLGLQCLLMSPRAVVDEIIECSFGALALAKKQGLVDLLGNFLTKGGIE